ncbi:peptidase S8/S53 domain-containing protein [Chytridium lagenaria]|nr:peptidase S8/S53 domain-containing protein [Chytridium lagenaria]
MALQKRFPLTTLSKDRPWYHQLSRRLFFHGHYLLVTLTYSSNGRLEPIRVGIIDSGVDYRHPALGGCFGLGCRVRYGFDFTSDLSDPMDCTGHGTHVAGLIAARNDPASLVRGVFPDAVIGAYKIFWMSSRQNVLGEDRSEETRDSVQENGTSQQRKTGVSKKKKSRTTSDALIAAMEMAVRDGMDVVNLSVGGLSSWPEFPEARAAQAMIERGIVVVAAQGNHAIDGPWSVSSPAIASGVISVAATETDYFLGGTATAGSIDASESFSFNYSSIIDITAVLFKSQNNPVKHVTRILYTDSEVCTDTSLHQFNVEQMLDLGYLS